MRRVLISILLMSILFICTNCSSINQKNSNNVVAKDSTKPDRIVSTQKPSNVTIDSLKQDTKIGEKLESLNGLKVIQDQSFNVTLENWGKVKLVSTVREIDSLQKLQLYLVKGNSEILYTFPDFYGNQWSMFWELKAVSLKDIDKDGLKDIVVITEYMTGIGETGAIPFNVASVYFQDGKGFHNILTLDDLIQKESKNKNIDMVVKFATDNVRNCKK